MKIKSIIKHSLFAKSFNLLKANPGKAGLMILFDVSFFLSFYYILPLLARYFTDSLIIPQQLVVYLYALLSFAYIIFQLFLYSFFKYALLDSVRSIYQKTIFSFDRLGKFFILNFLLIIPLFFAYNFVLDGIKEAYRPYFFVFTGIPIFLMLYVILNLSHSFFYEGNTIMGSLRKSFAIAFGNIKAYREAISIIILTSLFLGLLFLIAGYLIRIFTSQDYILYLSIYGYFKRIAIIILDLVLYFIIITNRISFYSIARQK